MFEDGSKGYVHHIFEDHIVILHLGTKPPSIGTIAVVQHNELVTKVGKDFIGRVISVTGEPLDGGPPIAADDVWGVFNDAPLLYERQQLDTGLETGIIVIDTLFPLMRGQRMAMLGDGKVGKSTLATQIALNQQDTDVIVFYALVAKRRSDVNALINHLKESGAMSKTTVIVSTLYDSLVMSHLAPYVACSMAEYFWQKIGQDVMVVYDYLTAHAHAYREIALLSGMSPGRDSFPGDMFYVHSSLLERAGKIAKNTKTFTCIPLVYAASGDITAYLPTNIMSITDGQWILDMDLFRDTKRPAISVGLSVSRVGGRGQIPLQRKQADLVFKSLTAYKTAAEFARFGSELSATAKADLSRGERLYKLLNQIPGERYNVRAQTLMIDIVLNLAEGETLDMAALKANAIKLAPKVKQDSDFDSVRDELKKLSLAGGAAPKPADAAKSATPPAAPATPAASGPPPPAADAAKKPVEPIKDEKDKKPAEAVK